MSRQNLYPLLMLSLLRVVKALIALGGPITSTCRPCRRRPSAHVTFVPRTA